MGTYRIKVYYTKAPSRVNCYYKDFSIEDGAVKTGMLKWDDQTSSGTKKVIESAILLKGVYTMRWHKYSTIDNSTNGEFCYLISHIE